MKFSIILLSFFSVGILIGIFELIPREVITSYPLEDYLLYLLLFLVGISIGSDNTAIKSIFKLNLITGLVPVMVAIGSILGAGFAVFFVSIPDLRECMAIGAGFGYYSLSSIIIGKVRGEVIGAIALISNIIREIVTLIFAPLFARYIAKLAPIASGGATSMDTTLPIIYKNVGSKYSLIAVINGAVLSFLVPIIIPIILS